MKLLCRLLTLSLMLLALVGQTYVSAVEACEMNSAAAKTTYQNTPHDVDGVITEQHMSHDMHQSGKQSSSDGCGGVDCHCPAGVCTSFSIIHTFGFLVSNHIPTEKVLEMEYPPLNSQISSHFRPPISA